MEEKVGKEKLEQEPYHLLPEPKELEEDAEMPEIKEPKGRGHRGIGEGAGARCRAGTGVLLARVGQRGAVAGVSAEYGEAQ